MRRLAVALAILLLLAAPASSLEVSQENIDRTICRPGWSKAQRPPVAKTNRIKRARLGPKGRLSAFELDHVIPLGLGGCPLCESNLQLQPWPEARQKDRVETRMHRLVCKHEVALGEARLRVLNWRNELKKERTNGE